MSKQNNQSIQQINTVGAAHTRRTLQPDAQSQKQKPVAMLEAAAAARRIKDFITPAQLEVIGNACRGEEREFFKAKLVELSNIIETMPVTYQTDGQGDQAIVHLHYFAGAGDWYITERDRETEQLQAFGEADLGYGGELGYISIVELLACGAELDLHWTPKSLNAIKAEQAMQNVNYVGHPMHY
jgi:hypothetical protein